MSTFPDIEFHRFFQSDRLSFADRNTYTGKQDLNDLETNQRKLLVAIQDVLNDSLYNEKKDIPEHKPHPPFHFDYIRSTCPNALAFRYNGYSFIGITIALVYVLWESCSRLSRSERVAEILGTPFSADTLDPVHVVLFQTQLSFVVAHEYTHHVHGHIMPESPDPAVLNEIMDSDATGNIDQQAFELDADAYSVYHVLSHLFGPRRSATIESLKIQSEPVEEHDTRLFVSFVIAVGAFLFVRPPISLIGTNIESLTHPPQAARMNYIMKNAIGWCEQNRPSLVSWMTREKFEELMAATGLATWGMNGGYDWAAQTTYLRSEEGERYCKRLEQLVKEHVSAL